MGGILIYETLRSGTADRTIAIAQEIKDSSMDKMQSAINEEFGNSIKEIKENMGKVTDSSFPVLTTYAELDAIGESGEETYGFYRFIDMETASEVEPNMRRNGIIFYQKTELYKAKTFIGYKQDDRNDNADVIFCCEKYSGNGVFEFMAPNIPDAIVQETGNSTESVMSQDAVTRALAERDDKISALEEQIKSLSPLSAVSVLLTDGSLVNKRDIPSSGYSKDEVVGFAIKTSNGNILVHPDISTQTYYFCNGVSKCDGYEVTEQNSEVSYASLDMDGKGNTDKLCTTLTLETWACNVARNTVWKDGRQGHMMSLGEALIIDSNIDDLNECRTKCGCEAVPKINYWTSTLNAKSEDGTILSTWIENCYGYRDGANVQGICAVLPVAELDV